MSSAQMRLIVGGAIAQLVEPPNGEEDLGLIPDLAACSLLIGSVSV